MACIGRGMPDEAKSRFERFLSGESGERVFTYPIDHPSGATDGFCYMDIPLVARWGFFARAALLQALLKLPFCALTVRYLRMLGARVGERVSISPGVWIDPVYPELLTLEDDVFIGAGAKIGMHELSIGEFRAGRVIVRKEALIGAFSLIGSGVEIGERATVAAGAVLRADVPAGATAIGNPARIIRRQAGKGE
jgi:acetyltransferase-like isoleucine patch superfamily enzyme